MHLTSQCFVAAMLNCCSAILPLHCTGPAINYPPLKSKQSLIRHGNQMERIGQIGQGMAGAMQQTNCAPPPLKDAPDGTTFLGLPKIMVGMNPTSPGKTFSWHRNVQWSKRMYDVSQRALERAEGRADNVGARAAHERQSLQEIDARTSTTSIAKSKRKSSSKSGARAMPTRGVMHAQEAKEELYARVKGDDPAAECGDATGVPVTLGHNLR